MRLKAQMDRVGAKLQRKARRQWELLVKVGAMLWRKAQRLWELMAKVGAMLWREIWKPLIFNVMLLLILSIVLTFVLVVIAPVAKPQGIMAGLSALITLNAVVFALIYATTQRVFVLFMRDNAGKSFFKSAYYMWMLPMLGVMFGVLYMVWQPDEASRIGKMLWVTAATFLTVAPVFVPLVAIQELRAQRPLSADAVDRLLAKKSKSRSRKRCSSDNMRLLRVCARDFEVDPQDPFAGDVLGRRRVVETVCRVVSDIASPAVLLVDGEWGSGKTVFTRMCAALLRSESFKGWGGTVIEFNAWTQSHTREPLRDLVSVLTKKIDGDYKLHGMLLDLLKDRLLLKAATDAVVDPTLLPRYELGTETTKFKEVLKAFVDSSGERVVVFIDELDRCRPDHALRVLETVRNLLDVDGVIVVVTVNLRALEHAVASLLGPDCDAERYLRRFIDLRMALPAPQSKDLQRFYRHLLKQTGLDERFKGRESYARHILGALAAVHPGSLRDLAQAVHRAMILLASIGPGSASDNSSVVEVWEQTALTLLVLREADRKAYENFVHRRIDGCDAGNALVKALPQRDMFIVDPDAVEGPPTVSVVLSYRMEALLLAVSQDGYPVVFPKNLHDRYEDRGRGEHWLGIREQLRMIRQRIEGKYPDLQELVDLIELASYEPQNTRATKSDSA